jgi:hypothetical protein
MNPWGATNHNKAFVINGLLDFLARGARDHLPETIQKRGMDVAILLLIERPRPALPAYET